jgi:beta-lactamase regulating signal transducer with metallopeptidase domain
MGAAAVMPNSPQMVAVVPVDSNTTVFGVLMFLPMLALILAAIVLTAAIQDVMPSLIQPLIKMQIADAVSLIWVIVGGLVVLLLLILMFSAMSGGGGGGTKAKKEKAPKKEKKAKKKRK